MAKSKPEIKRKSKQGGKRSGAGRKPKPANVIRAEVREVEPDILERVDLALREIAPQCVLNLITLANGGYQRVEEKWEMSRPSNPETGDPATFELIEKKISYAEPDRAANQYLLDRVLGKPKQAVEVTGKDGGAIPIEIYLPDNGRDHREPDPHAAQLPAPGDVPLDAG